MCLYWLLVINLFIYASRTLGVTGTLFTNGKPRDSRIFHKLSCYITQEDLIQPLLTVQEIMMVAAQLKLPSHTSENRRLSTVIS
jgi:ABC-type multidrug transport system ATPase subunit